MTTSEADACAKKTRPEADTYAETKRSEAAKIKTEAENVRLEADKLKTEAARQKTEADEHVKTKPEADEMALQAQEEVRNVPETSATPDADTLQCVRPPVQETSGANMHHDGDITVQTQRQTQKDDNALEMSWPTYLPK
jgi:hypothetical protein